MGARTRRWRRG
uniref:Uncharacterized protein n=1 Tax=Arundo donax TaxID=35708 RepID=A0A0A8YME5_ARUDO